VVADPPDSITATDLDDVLALNQSWVPHVGSLDRPALESLLVEAAHSESVRGTAGELLGFLVALGPGADYTSPNYRWFAERHRRFLYVDRIAVSPGAQGRGIGRRLYESAAVAAVRLGAPVLCCEVNLFPPNPESQQFHAALGFVEVARQWTYGDTVEVQLLERPV
jgi:predicted GNAT superfamily acetyltransferase